MSLGANVGLPAPSSLEEQAKRNFNCDFNCAEAVLLAVSESGLFSEGCASFIPRVATGFGGGMGQNGDLCGAVAAGAMAISLALGRDSSEQSRGACYSAVDQFHCDFVKKFGSTRCRKLTGVDLKTLKGKAAQDQVLKRCSPFVAWAARRAHELIQEKAQKQ